jgi:peptidoglycan/xylan/chitin deacetylase (PgdA/CDA1 family)
MTPYMAVIWLSSYCCRVIVTGLVSPNHPVSDQQPALPPLVTHGSRALSEVALTFDACPAIGYDAAIVHILTETQTPATFFLSGRWMQTHVSATQALAAIQFFELGEHS